MTSMQLINHILLFGSFLFLISILASVLSTRLGLPLLLIFLVVGMLAGEDGLGGIVFNDFQLAYLFGSLALAIILYDGGLHTEVRRFRVGLWPAMSLATVGVLVTAGITGWFAIWILGLYWLEGLLIGAIVGSTDAAAVFSLLHSAGLELKERTGATLEIESGTNDPMAIFLTIGLVALLEAGHTQLDWSLMNQFAAQMGIGVVAGLAGGIALAWLINHLSLSASFYPLVALGGGVLIFAATAVVGGSGFLAIYLAGLMLGNRPLQASQNIRRFHEGMAWLSQIGMFLMLGLLVTPSNLLPVALPGLAIALVLIFVARPVAVVLGLLPFRFPWREHVYIGWVGLRGAVPIILGIFPLLAGLEHAALYFNVAFFVVLVSLLLQGSTVAVAARLLNLEVPPANAGIVQRVELELPGRLDYELVVYELAPDSPVLQKKPSQLSLPPTAQVAGLLRDGVAVAGCEQATLKKGDYVLLLTQPADLSLLDRLFIEPHTPPRLEERRFFGEFVLSAEARLGDLAALYGFAVPADSAQLRLGEYLAGAFHHLPVVGDRVKLGNVELVVREMEGNRIAKVGLKLSQ